MIEKIVRFFLRRHLLTNLIFVSVFMCGILAWMNIPKEELPDITFDTVRISVNYPGASAEDVEYYVTEPIEEAVRSLDGVYRVYSSTGAGTSSVTVEIEKFHPDKEAVINEIRGEVIDVRLPAEIIDQPNIRVFKTSRKAIMDVGLIFREKTILDVSSREMLQKYVLALEDRLMALPEVSRVDRSGYLKNEIHINIFPEKLIEYNVPFNTVMREVSDGNVRQPAGNIENINEPKVTLAGELDTVEKIKDMSVQGGFEGQIIRVSDLAEVEKGYEKTKSVLKINGHEGIFLNVAKNTRYGIVESAGAIEKAVSDFRRQALKGTDIEIVLLDDESFDVKNRLKLIGLNGLMGFILVLIILFIFLDLRAGTWVAMGIPFTFCFTILAGFLIGYSVNNITLAAIIIVMGMVVDDAIVVAENISRLRSDGMEKEEAAVKGVSFVFLPIVASILTTCVAFVPLFFFSGRFGAMVKFIPAVVFLMLGGSLFEALFILPGHMTISLGNDGWFKRMRQKMFFPRRLPTGPVKEASKPAGKVWLKKIENGYESLVTRLLKYKVFVLAVFVAAAVISFHIAAVKMKFVMFPDEETSQISLSGETPPGTTKYNTARMTQPIEDLIMSYSGDGVVGLRNQLAQTRRGSVAKENSFRMRIEITPKEERKRSADDLIKEWTEKISAMPGISKLRVSKTWHGQDSSSPIEIMIKENDNAKRYQMAEELAEEMKKYPYLDNVEIDRPIYTPEYRLTLNRDLIRRLAINPSDIARTLRASLEGTILYEFRGIDETVYTRLTIVTRAKDDINKIFDIPIENRGQYLVPLRDLVKAEEVEVPDSIIRDELKRSTVVYADIKRSSRKTPLEIAEYFEEKIFPLFGDKYPTSVIEFRGEVKDTRESGGDFAFAMLMAGILIYIILALLFDSLFKPFLIMTAIPFGVMGIILAFWAHGISMYGFFAVIGALGLAGVVVNDSIIMLSKLDVSYDISRSPEEKDVQIAAIAKTRLRAVVLTTITTVAAIIPTAYGWAGYDSMLAQMMLALSWGLLFGTLVTLVMVPCMYSFYRSAKVRLA
jgi:multidrug efflux pump subunit AcrB